jgi:hypothetical protein
MKKLLLKSILLLCALIVGSSNVWAAEASFEPSNFSGQGTSGSGSAISATVNGVTFACDKGYGTTQIRCYSGGKITISSSNTITAIAFTFSGSYNGGLETSYTSLSTTSWEKTLSSQARITAITVTYTASGSPSSAAFADANPSIDLKDATSYTQTATTADGYAETDGASVTYTITANTAEASIDENTGEVTPTKAGSVTVQATAAAIAGKFDASSASYTLTVTDTRTYTVTCHVGNSVNNVDRTSGATLSLDTPTAIAGMSFVGWSSTNNVAAPVWVENTTNVTSDMELYAIYEAVAGEYSYHLVEADQADWRGDYLIAYSDDAFANGKASGTSGIGSTSTVQDPNSNLSGKIVNVTWGDSYHVTLEAIDDDDLSKGYVLKTQDNTYNYQTGNSTNGIGGTTLNKETAANYAITVNYVSSSEINLTLTNGPVFRYNTSEKYFRYYKSTSYASMGEVYLYKRTTDVEPVYSLGLTATITLAAACTDGAGKYFGTYSSSKAFEVPEGLTVSEISVISGELYVEDYATGDIVPANTGVMVSSTTAGDHAVALATGGTSVLGSDNMLKASGDAGIDAATMNEADTKFYRLTMHNGTTIGFWWGAADGASFALAANKAYLAVPNGALSAREFVWFNNETTGVKAIENSQLTIDNSVYDLQGRRVAKPTKGLYIVNGKKVIIK